MYAKLKVNELAERLSTVHTGLNKATGDTDMQFSYFPLDALIVDWLINKGYSRASAEMAASSVLSYMANMLLKD